MSQIHYRSSSRESALPLSTPPSRTEFSEAFTSFPAEGIKDSQHDNNIISNLFSRFKSAASSAVQQVIPIPTESSLPSSMANDTQLLNSLAATTRPSRISSGMSNSILISPNSHSRSSSRSMRTSSNVNGNTGRSTHPTQSSAAGIYKDQDAQPSNHDFRPQSRFNSHASSNNIYKPGITESFSIIAAQVLTGFIGESHDDATVTKSTNATSNILDKNVSTTTGTSTDPYGGSTPKIPTSNDTDSKPDPKSSNYNFQQNSSSQSAGILKHRNNTSNSLHTHFSVSAKDQDSLPNMSSNQDSLYSTSRDNLSGNTPDRDGSSDTESIVSTARHYFISRVDRRPAPLKSGGLGKEFWMKDENATECFGCSTTFTSKLTLSYYCIY